MKTIRYCLVTLFDFLFPKAAHIRQLETLESSELITLLSRSKEHVLPALPHITSLFPYRDPNVHDVIHEIKYATNKQLAANIVPALIQLCPQDSIITFVPVTESRKEKHGFDQGLLILNAMKACAPDYIYERNLLAWNRKVTQQSLTESKEARMQNMRHALVCPDTEKVRGKTIVVLDDVCTTGATLYEAQRALEDSGASRVVLLTLAH
ncbi:MAG: hypothetical protein RLY57_419 [Candidatus Parcubacteria bacterium]|jgi:predicted amidophosphoribosyltransferase